MRLFFALWPDEPAAARLAALSRELATLSGGRPVAVAKIHLTLAFLGDVEDSALEPARRAVEGSRHPPFEVALDQVGSFKGARVAWAGCAEPSRGLVDLQSELDSRLRRAGFALDERPYTPHVTLARKVTRAMGRTPTEPIRWRARSFALVRSELGRGSYATLEEWALG
jgi:2'-5' RNA ligase